MNNNVHSDGLLINNEAEYMAFIARKRGPGESIERIYEVFGKPKEYPFVLLLRKPSNPVFNIMEIHFVYLKPQPSTYLYYDPAD